jgi:hypothetical protein
MLNAMQLISRSSSVHSALPSRPGPLDDAAVAAIFAFSAAATAKRTQQRRRRSGAATTNSRRPYDSFMLAIALSKI